MSSSSSSSSSSYFRSSKAPIPSWYFLVLGVSLGYNVASFSGQTLTDLFYDWQSLVNVLLVPVYSLCVVVYLGSLVTQVSVKNIVSIFQSFRRKEELLVVDELPEGVIDDHSGHVDMNGTYQLVRSEGFDEFLAIQGVPAIARKAIAKAKPAHQFTHRGNMLQITIKGIWESSTTYQIDGPPRETNIRGRIFQDTVRYLESNDGIETHKKAVTEDYDIFVTRKLSEDRKQLVMTSRAVFRDEREDIESIQYFERVK